MNTIVLRKYRLIFELCHNFYLIFFNFGHTLSKNRLKPIFVGYKLIFLMDLCSTNGLFLFTLGVFIVLSVIAYFMSSFCFLVIILLLTKPNKKSIVGKMHSVEKGVSGYVNYFSCKVYAFWTETQLSRKIQMDFFLFLPMFVLFCCCTHYI